MKKGGGLLGLAKGICKARRLRIYAALGRMQARCSFPARLSDKQTLLRRRKCKTNGTVSER